MVPSTPTRTSCTSPVSSGHKSGGSSDDYYTEESGPPTGSEAKVLHKLMTMKRAIALKSTKILINGEVVTNDMHNMDIVKTGEILSCLEVLNIIGVASPYSLDSLSTPSTDFTQLLHQSETEFQISDHFQKSFVQCLHAQSCDFHVSGKGLFAMPSSMDRTGLGVIRFTAKPDIASLVLPLSLELKSDKSAGPICATDFEVILQSIERVEAQLESKATLVRSMCLAVTSRSAHLIHLHKNEAWVDRLGPTRSYYSLDIVRINITDVNLLWCALTQVALAQPGFYAARDASALQEVLIAAGIPTYDCRTTLISFSETSAVYFVTLPDSGVIKLNCPSLAVKLNYDVERSRCENNAHLQIAATYMTAGVEYYAKAIMMQGVEGEDCFTHLDPKYVLSRESSVSLPNRERLVCGPWLEQALEDLRRIGDDPSQRIVEAWSQPSWMQQTPSITRAFGAVIMLPGKQCNNPIADADVRRMREPDLRDAFHMLSRARVWHTDYRSANVLYIVPLRKWHIIDFDHAICTTTETVVNTVFVAGSNRAEVCGREFIASCPALYTTQAGVKVTVPWDERKETTMFELLLRRMSK